MASVSQPPTVCSRCGAGLDDESRTAPDGRPLCRGCAAPDGVETAVLPVVGAVSRPPPPPPDPALDAPWLNRTIGGYEITAVLGRGSIGTVYLADDTKLGRKVAVKAVAVSDAKARERLLRDARTAAGLNHPCLLSILDLGEHEGYLYIVSENMTRGTLAGWVESHGPADPAEAAMVAVAIARGLGYAHQRGITHRDVRPSNIYLGEGNLIKLGDFGLARTLDETAQLTRSGMVINQVQYAAPEICKGEPTGPATDLYSLGGVLHFLLTGKAPFPGDSPGPVITAKLKGVVPDVRQARPDLPAELAELTARALAPDPKRRAAGVDEWADAVKAVARRIFDSRPPGAGAAPPPSRAVRIGVDAAPAPAAPASQAAKAVKPARRDPSPPSKQPVFPAPRSTVSLSPLKVSAPPGYELLEELGRGGMAVVYKARDTRLNRHVALKMILGGAHAGADRAERFRREAEAVAALNHPNIVQVYEVGEHENLPFLSLEFCGGGTLAGRLRGTTQPARQAAAMLEIVARAAGAAHKAGIVHRDIKPDNVLFTEAGVAKLTDFGIAKRTGATDGPTGTQAAIGTLRYMAPEQAEGRKDIGPAADIYALGAVLYEALTGRPPFVGESEVHTMYQVLSVDPVPVRRLAPKVPADLETICHKALHKDPRRRYADAEAFADDLRAFLEDKPIKARPVGPAERALKWAARNPATAALVAVSVVAAVGLLSGAVAFSAVLAGKNEELASANEGLDLQRRAAERQADLAARQRALAEENAAEAGRQRARAESSLADALRARYTANARLAEQARAERRLRVVQEQLDQMRPRPGEPDLRGFEWYSLARVIRRERMLLSVPGLKVSSLTFLAGGKTLAVGGLGGPVQLFNAADGKPKGTLGHKTVGTFSLAFAPNEKLVALGGEDGRIRLVETASRKEIAELPGHVGWTAGLAFHPDGRTLISVGRDPHLKLWDIKERRELRKVSAHVSGGLALVLSPDGSSVVSGGIDLAMAALRVREFGNLVERFSPAAHQLGIRAVARAPDGSLYASGGADGVVKIWDLTPEKEREVAVLRGHSGWVMALAFSPDGRTLATAGLDGSVKLWDPVSGKELGTVGTHKSEISCLAFTPDGKTLATGSSEGLVKLWDLAEPPETDLNRSYGDLVLGAAVSPDGRTAAATGLSGEIVLWDTADGRKIKSWSGHLLAGFAVAFSPDGKTLVSGGGDESVKFWDLATGMVRAQAEGFRIGATALRFSPDGTRLAAGSGRGELKLLDAATGTILRSSPAHRNAIRALAFSPDGATLVSGGLDGKLQFWGAADLRKGKAPVGHTLPISDLVFSPDGRTVVSAGADGNIKLWDPAEAREIAMFRGGTAMTSLAFAPLGGLLAAGGADGSLRLWDLTSRQVRTDLPGHQTWVSALAFSPDGRTLISGGFDKAVVIRRTVSERSMVDHARRQSRDAPGHAEVQRDLALACWGYHLDRLRASDPAEARAALHLGRDTVTGLLGRPGSDDAQLRLWLEEFDKAIGLDAAGGRP